MTLKKTFLILLAATGAQVSLAQQRDVKPDSVSTTTSRVQQFDVRPDTVITTTGNKYRVQMNSFWEDWFVGAGFGAQVYLGDHDRQRKFTERISPAFNLNVGKWFSPVIGVRAGLSGFKIKGLTQNAELSTGDRYEGKPWEGYGLYKQEFNYMNINADVLFNLSNLISGYEEYRVYTISPYAGLGWMATNDKSSRNDLSANFGFLNAFRLNEKLELTLDLRGTLVSDNFDGDIGGSNHDGMVTTLVGLTYKFKGNTWQKPKTIVIKYNEELLISLRESVSKLAQDNEALKQQLSSSQSKTITDIKVEEKILAAPILVTFPINKSTVNNDVRVNLGFFAKVIKSGNSDIVYQIAGYADKGTGTEEHNLRLSQERAQAIYNILVHEFNVNPNQLEIQARGGVTNQYYDDARLSRAVITIAK